MKSPTIYDENNWDNRCIKKFGCVKGILLIVSVVWFVPAVISTVMGYPLVLDYATNMRTLISLPLFVLSSSYVVRKINWIIDHFITANLIREDQMREYRSLIESTNCILNSKKIKLFLLFIVIVFIFFEIRVAGTVKIIPWRSLDNPATWWFYFISHPIYSYLLTRFLLKAILWWRFFFRLSRMKLVMRGAHGDGVGGLGFLSTSLNSLIFPGLAFSSSAAAGAANLLIYGDMTLPGLQVAFACFVGGLAIVLIGPLFFFVPTLMREREESIHKYGMLSSKQLTQFEDKWFVKDDQKDALTVPDFSATTDYNSEIGRVHSIKFVPIKLVDAIALLIAISIPFAPVFALEMPWQDVLKHMLDILR